jgi:transcriptional regulator with XRE-family HTH domain
LEARKGGKKLFGELIKDKRKSQGIGLREFCRRIGADSSNWSKTERGLLYPPREEETLRKIAKILGIEVGSEEWLELKDKAYIDAGQIPRDILSDAGLVELLPSLFRALRVEWRPWRSWIA